MCRSIPLALAVGLLCVLTTSAAPRVKRSAAESDVPQAAVPLMHKAPEIDGRVSDDEWRDATGWTAFVLPRNGYVLPAPMQARVWVGRDADRLLLAFRAAKAPGLQARGKSRDDASGIESGDHWWIAFLLGDVRYDIKVDPKGTLSDQRTTPADAGLNRHVAGIGWDSGAEVRTSIQDACWEVEMAVPFASFGLDQAPKSGASWRAWISYGRGYGGRERGEWNGAVGWLPGEWGLLVFSDAVPGFQIEDLGPLEDLGLSPRLRVANDTDAAREVRIRVELGCGPDVLRNLTRTLSLAPGASETVSWPPMTVKLPEGWTGRVTVEADSGRDHLYSAMLSFAPMSAAQYLELAAWWPFESPLKAQWVLGCANYPYFGSMDVWVDVTGKLLPRDVAQAASAELTLVRAGEDRPVRGESLKLVQGRARSHWDGVDLPEGRYELVGRLFDAAGRAVGVTVRRAFVRKVFAWEHNTLGVSDAVYPPYKAIGVEESGALRPWGRLCESGPCGLPGKVTTTSETDAPGLTVCDAARLEARIGGKDVTLAGTTRIALARPGRVTLAGEGRLGEIAVSGEAFMLCDGWRQVTLTLTPAGPARIDSLELVIPFGPQVDTYSGYRRSWFYGGLPAGEGVLWQNVAKGENLFTPAIAVGNGDAALWWYADGDETWLLDYGQPSQLITRERGVVHMRHRIVNHPVTLDKPLTVTFAVLANPVRPDPPDRRRAEWLGDGRFHDTSGYAYWGNGIDSITPGSDAEYDTVRRAIDVWTGRLKPGAPSPFPPIILYNSGAMLGQGMEEFDTFSGEWAGLSPIDPTPEFPDSDRHARVNWMSQKGADCQKDWRGQPKRLGPTRADMVQSNIDCRIWYYRLNMEKLGNNGYWFDNAPIWAGTNVSTGRAYLTASGTVRPRYGMFGRQELFRRLFTVYAESGRRPFNLISYGPDFSFAQWIWMTEMDAYVYAAKDTLYDTLEHKRYYDIISQQTGMERAAQDPVARHRAITRLRRIPGATRSNVSRGNAPASRSVIGLALLHDFGVHGGVEAAQFDLTAKILDAFGFFDEGVEYLPYWRNGATLRFNAQPAVASLYRHPKTGAILCVVVNPGREAAEGAFALAVPAGAKAVLIDAESGEAIPGRVLDGVFTPDRPLSVPPRNHRILLLKPLGKETAR